MPPTSERLEAGNGVEVIGIQYYAGRIAAVVLDADARPAAHPFLDLPAAFHGPRRDGAFRADVAPIDVHIAIAALRMFYELFKQEALVIELSLNKIGDGCRTS